MPGHSHKLCEVERAAGTYITGSTQAPGAAAAVDHQTFTCQGVAVHRMGGWGGEMPSPGLALLYGVGFFAVSPAETCLFSSDVTALVSFRRNLSLVKELGDRAAQGRAYGNLGNTQYLLGNFSEAIAFHKEVGGCCAFSLGPGVVTGC